MPTGNAPIPSLLFSSANAHRHEKLGPHTDLYMAGMTWLHLFKELPFKREYGEKKIIEMKAQLTESDRSIEEFIEVCRKTFQIIRLIRGIILLNWTL